MLEKRPNSAHARTSKARHVVAVIGGATAGAEIAGRLASHETEVVIFERNPRPYGKIEDGLPRWHSALRDKECAAIDEKLRNENVHYVPCSALGIELSIEELVHGWGFSAVVLAVGAWKDRPLPIPGASAYVNRGLVYQNPFIISFNHSEDPTFSGTHFEASDGVLVVGGGLASIDVMKVLMLETTRKALRTRGIEVALNEIETKGIPKILGEKGLRWKDLRLKGATLFFRRGPEETSLVGIPPNASSEQIKKVQKSRVKVLKKAQEKYLFNFEPFSVPDGFLIDQGRVAGLRLRRTRVEGDLLILTGETFDRQGAYVVSSIGSIPEPIPGLPMAGELFAFSNPQFGRFAEHPTIFAAGNAVTGQGNIVASRNHARLVSEEALERYLGLAEGTPSSPVIGGEIQVAAETAGRIQAHLDRARLPSVASYSALIERVTERQVAVGYTCNYAEWIRRSTPIIDAKNF